MARLPQPGGDEGAWGDILNEFLAQAHNADGTLKQLSQAQVQNLIPNLAAKANAVDLKPVATSGSYADLSGKPPIPSTAADVGAVSSTGLDAATAALVDNGSSTTSGALEAAYASSTVGNRLRRAAHSSTRKDGLLPVMAAPPAVTTGSSNLDATLTRAYRTSTGQANCFRFTGGAVQAGPGAYSGYYVAPVVTMPSGTGGNMPGSGGTKNVYQWSVEFFTDAPKVMLRLLTTASIQIEVNDQPVASTTTAIGGVGGTMYALLDFTSVGGSAIRKLRVEFNTASGFDGVYVGPLYSVWTPISETNLKVVTVGDSIDTGTGATMPNGAWQKVTGKILGWTDVRQVSFGGTGFTNVGGSLNVFGATQRVADVVSHAPDLLIITASQNDDGATASTITTAALAAFQAYRAALPNVPIVVFGADAGSSGPSATRKANDSAVHSAFTQWSDPASWWIENVDDPAGSWQFGTGHVGATVGDGNRDRFGFDGAHPNDLGHQYLGYRFANTFRATVLPLIT